MNRQTKPLGDKACLTPCKKVTDGPHPCHPQPTRHGDAMCGPPKKFGHKCKNIALIRKLGGKQ